MIVAWVVFFIGLVEGWVLLGNGALRVVCRDSGDEREIWEKAGGGNGGEGQRSGDEVKVVDL